MTFNELKIIDPILKALSDKNYTNPTPIQEKAIPLILNKEDVLGVAQTGTGKTAAFAIPILQRLAAMPEVHNGKPKIGALIVTPTRELAIQIQDNIKEYGKNLPLRNAVIFGGVKQGKQVEALKRGVDILVATPGRLLDLMNQGYIRLDHIKIFVLDEADRMLDMGFIHDIKKLLKVLPQQRQSLFFSATMPSNIQKLSQEILRSPKKIEVTPASSTAETIQQYLYYTNKSSKKKLLLHILEDPKMKQVLLFSRTKHGADRIVRDLVKAKISAAAIHGDKGQNQRQRALKDFKDGKLRILVATDIAARGIDIDKLQFVVNFDVPDVPETYIHRIGRSGRAGEAGVAISMAEPEENQDIKSIERLSKKRLTVISDHPFPQTESAMTAAEKKEWNKEKQRKKQEFFANRKKSGNSGGNFRRR